MLVLEIVVGVDVGEQGEDQHLVISLPGRETLPRLLHLGLHEALPAGEPVLLLLYIVVEPALRDGGGGVQELQRLQFIVVEELQPEFVPALFQGLGAELLYWAVRTVVFYHQFPVDVEAGTVVGGDIEGVFFGLPDLQRGLEQRGVVVDGVHYVQQVEIALYALDVRLSEGREVRKEPLRPVVPYLVVHGGGPVAARRQEQQGGQGNDELLHIF